MKKNQNRNQQDRMRDQESFNNQEDSGIREDRLQRDQSNFEGDTSSYEGANVEEDEDDEGIHNPNVQKSRDMKREERDNIE